MASTRVGNTAFISTLLLVLLAGTLVKNWEATYVDAPGFDFYQFWLVMRCIDRVDDRNIYTPDARQKILWLAESDLAGTSANSRQAAGLEYRKGVIETYGSPLFYCFIRLFSGMAFDAAFAVYALLATVCLVASVIALAWIVGYGFNAIMLVTLFVLLGCQQATIDIGMGNLNCLELAGLTLFLVVRRNRQPWIRDILSGVLLAVLVLFKPNILAVPALLFARYLMCGQLGTLGRQLVGCVVGLAASLAVSATLLPLGSWMGWVTELKRMNFGGIMPLNAGNVSLAHLVSDWGAPSATVPFIIVTLCLAGLWLFRDRELPEIVIVGLGVLIMLLASQLAWFHYFVLSIPLVIYGLRRTGHTVAFAGAVVVTVFLFQCPAIPGLSGLPPWTWPIQMGGAEIVLGIACLLWTQQAEAQS